MKVFELLEGQVVMELTGVKRFHKYTESELYKILRRMGIKVIDGGSYGTILSSDKWDYVVKLFSDDPYYLSFVKFVKSHPNKHYPKFTRGPFQAHLFHTRDERDGDKMWMLKIEKLQKLDDATARFIVRKLEMAMTVSYWLKTEKSNSQSKDYLDDKEAPRDYIVSTKNVTTRQWAKDHEWLISLADAWQAILEDDDVIGSDDLHARNFMKRKDGTVVIIDPLWEGTNPYKEYNAWYRTMTDTNYSDEYDEPSMKSGPSYKHNQKKPVKVAPQNADDDIPF